MERRELLRRKRRRGKLRNKLMYGIVAVSLVLLFFLVYSVTHHENPSPDNQTSQPRAALIDHLSFSSPPANETFKVQCRTILEDVGFDYTYYEGREVTVNFYRNLPAYNYSLMILRVHSAVIKDTYGNPTKLIGLFTSEISNNITESKYSFEISQGYLAKARLFSDNDTYYFGITPWFVKDSMIGNFKETVIMMMGCEGLNHTSMAEALVQRGAKVYISWTGPVGISHTDDTTIRLLQSLLEQNLTIRTAVEGISSDPTWWWSKLDYYPEEVGNSFLRALISGVTLSITQIGMSVTRFLASVLQIVLRQ